MVKLHLGLPASVRGRASFAFAPKSIPDVNLIFIINLASNRTRFYQRFPLKVIALIAGATAASMFTTIQHLSQFMLG